MSQSVGFDLWSDHVLSWWKHKDDPNVLFLKYEDLRKVCYRLFVCLFVCLFVYLFVFSVVDIKFCYSVYFNPRISPSSDLHWTMYDKF